MSYLKWHNCILTILFFIFLYNSVCATTDRKIVINATEMFISHSRSYSNSLNVQVKLRLSVKSCKMNKSNVECKKIYWSDWIEENRYFAHNNSELYQYKSKVAPADPLWTGIVLDNVETYGKDSSIIGVEVEGTFSDLSVNHGMTEEMHHLNGNRFEFQEFEPSSTFHLPINDPHHIIAIYLSGTILCPKNQFGCECERNCTADNIFTHCDNHGRKTCIQGSYPKTESDIQDCNLHIQTANITTEKICERLCYENSDDHFTCSLCGLKSCHYGYHHTDVAVAAGEPDGGTCERITCTWPPDSVLFPFDEGMTRCANHAPCVDRNHEHPDYHGFYDCDCQHISAEDFKYSGLRCEIYETATTPTTTTITTTRGTTTPTTTTRPIRTTSTPSTTDEALILTPTFSSSVTPAQNEDFKDAERGIPALTIIIALVVVVAVAVVTLVGYKVYRTYKAQQAQASGERRETGLSHSSPNEPAMSMSSMSASLQDESLDGGMENPHYQPL